MDIQFGDKTVSYEQFVEDVARKVAMMVTKNVRKADKQGGYELVTTKEAAQILGITPDRMRHIKDRFDCVKQGSGKQGKVLFRKDTLLARYTA